MADATATDDSERKLEGEKAEGVVSRWLKELEKATEHEEKWREKADKVCKLYMNEREKLDTDNASDRRFNILFANTEVLKGALYSQGPSPDVRRRHLDKDPVGRVAAVVMQRALIASLDQEHDGEDFDYVMRSSVSDMVLPGRAVARVKYRPTFSKIPPPQPATAELPNAPSQEGVGQGDVAEAAPQASSPPDQKPDARDSGPAVTAPPQEEVAYECTETEHIEWPMFRYSPAKRWRKVRWVAFGELLTRDDCIREFGEKLGGLIELKWMPKGVADTEENQIFKRALVWVIWNKTKREVVCVSEGHKEAPLRVVPDPLRLEGFFPCPRPMYSIFSTTDLKPVPEYTMYEDHALQLDLLEERIAVLTDALRRRGVYDAAIEELAGLENSGDNKFVPVKNYKEFLEKGGLDELFKELPIEGIAKVLALLMEQADAKKAQIYEVVGISDIMRGATKSEETLGAQKIKDQWGSVRTGPRQAEVQRYARDLIRIHAEIMAEHFSAKTLAAMSGIELFFTEEEKTMAQQAAIPPPSVAGPAGQPPQQAQPAAPPDPRLGRPTWDEVMQVLHSDKLRGFKVDIETDSTVKHRADDEQKNRVEFITAVTSFGEKWFPAVQQGLVSKQFAGELLAWGMRAFPVGSQIEELLDELTGSGVDQGQKAPNPEVLQLKQQLAELQPQADEANLKREEMEVSRDEIAARVTEMQTRAEESKRNKEVEVARVAGELKQHLGSDQLSAAIMQLVQVMASQQQGIAALLSQIGAQAQQPRYRELIRDKKGRAVGAIDKPMLPKTIQ